MDGHSENHANGLFVAKFGKTRREMLDIIIFLTATAMQNLTKAMTKTAP